MRVLSFAARVALMWGFMLLLAGCIDPYLPDTISLSRSYLVVDGFINSNGVTTITLSRTYNISSTAAAPTEAQAALYIEEEGGARYALSEGVRGTYTSAPLVLNTAKRYRLRVNTAAGKEYVSDFVPAKTTPPIDNVVWQADDSGLGIYVNSHDATGTTQYYRWEYEETWEIMPLLEPEIEYVNRRIQPITTPYPTVCWPSTKSTSISLSKTTSLSRDVIANYLLRSLPTTSDRLFHKYSILVKQHAQTREEYAYWELLRKNTENIGTLFDPLPSQLTGNVHCLNDEAELALGYIGAHTVEEKRIFIRRAELPGTWRLLTGYESCIPPDTARMIRDLNAVFSGGRIPLTQVPGGYATTTVDCVDCRKRGSAVRPAFWQ
jgi:hypothetical protein